MSWRGDDRLAWDEQKVLEGDPEAIAAVKEAERIFKEAQEKGATAFIPGNPAQRINHFDPSKEMVMVPRVVGG